MSWRRFQASASAGQKPTVDPTVDQCEESRPPWYPITFLKRVSQMAPGTGQMILEAYASFKDPDGRLRAPHERECA